MTGVRMLMMGEVHTGLLRTSAAVSPAKTRDLLTSVVGERVRLFSRPVDRAVSPAHLTGVDTTLPHPAATAVRAVGTIVSHSVITGGHVVQGSAYTQIESASTTRRMPWSHYLGRPGVLEPIGKVDLAQVTAGYLALDQPDAPSLDMAAVSSGALEIVQERPELDGRQQPFRNRRTRLKWAVDTAGAGTTHPLTFRLGGDDSTERSIRLPARDVDISAYARLCEDLALHDWLLTTVLSMVSRARIGSDDRTAVIGAIRPALDYLVHLWMPAMQIDPALVGFWDVLDDQAGLDKQWRLTVNRIRDQLALASVSTSSR